jgi:tRNA dimethylallyltransferase
MSKSLSPLVLGAENKASLVAITGPTASGKSAFALQLASHFNAEIISADSVQVYRGFDIGSATPEAEELNRIPHHLISCLEPEERFDAGRFRTEAVSAIADVRSRGRLPLISGGTGLYLRALLGGLIEIEVDPRVADDIEARIELEGLQQCSAKEKTQFLYQWLKELDPDSAQSISSADTQRIRRALAVYLSTGQSLLRLQTVHGHGQQEYRALICCFLPERSTLYAAIDHRVDEMFARGLIDEVRTLIARHGSECRAFSAIGYRHVKAYLENRCSREEMLQTMKRDTRRFAKRQLTWWRHQPDFLGWQRLASIQPSPYPSETRQRIIERLAPTIAEFLEQKEEFSEQQVYFLPIEDFAFN